VATDRPEGVEDLAAEIQAWPGSTLQGRGVDGIEGDPPGGHLGLAIPFVAAPGQYKGGERCRLSLVSWDSSMA
jgi:hypothetical protein